MSEAVADKKVLTGLDAMAELERLAEQQASPPPERQKELETATREELAKFEFEEQPVNLPAGWRLREWKQKHILAIFEAGPLAKALNGEYDNRWRRNDEVVKSVLDCDGFDIVNVTADDVDDMNWRDVEQLFLGIVAHYNNTVLVKKN